MKADNELIAEFMGYRPAVEDISINAYDTSWDWLMPVVEKIEGLGYFYSDSDGERIQVTNIQGKSKIEATYKAVVEFIKWYNHDSGRLS